MMATNDMEVIILDSPVRRVMGGRWINRLGHLLLYLNGGVMGRVKRMGMERGAGVLSCSFWVL
jgi:hypothetical protein